MKKFTTCLWFDHQAEEAAKFYCTVFKDGKTGEVTRYTSEGKEIHGQDAGKVMTVEFELLGQKFVALNGGPIFKFNESVSFMIPCDTQDEIDYYWNNFIDGGGKESQCGWLTDKYGVSWQVVSTALHRMMKDKDVEKVKRVTHAMLQMKKFNIAVLEKAFAG